jgi:hypothetical protein
VEEQICLSTQAVFIPFSRKRNIKGLRESILFSKIIQQSRDVKYLVLSLDKGLTWKKRWRGLSTRPIRPSVHAETRSGNLGD